MAQEEKEKDQGTAAAGGDAEEIKIVTDDDLQGRASSEEEGEEQEEGSQEERLGQEEEEPDPDRRRTREQRRDRRQRQKEAKERREREIAFLEKRNEHLEKQVSELAARMDVNEGTALDGRISQLKAAIKKSEEVIAEASSAGKGEDLVEATRIRDNLRDHLRVAEHAKTQKTDQSRRQPAAPDPAVASRAETWMRENSWFDPNRGDYKSRLAGAIDDSLISEGYDPRTDDYWEELNARVAEALPDVPVTTTEERESRRTNGREKKEQKERRNGAGGPQFRGGGRDRALKKGEFYLSKERVEAMKEAGVWDDPVLRQKYVKRYQQYDREHGRETSYDD